MAQVACRAVGAVADKRHVAQEYRRAFMHAHHHVGHLFGCDQKGAGLHQHRAPLVDDAAGIACGIGRDQCDAQVTQRKSVGREALGIELHAYRAIGPADGLDLARTRHTLQFGLDRVRHAQQVGSADDRIFAPQRRGEDRYVVDTLRLDQWCADAGANGQPVLVAVERVVQAHDGIGAQLPHLEAYGQRGHPGRGCGIDILDALDLGDDLLRGCGHQCLDLPGGGARIGNEHVGESHVDLRFFLAWRDQDREQPEQYSEQRDQRRDLAVKKAVRYAPGQPQPLLAARVHCRESPAGTPWAL